MEPIHIVYFKDIYLSDAETLLKDYPDIFSEHDYRLFREDLLEYLLDKPNHDTNARILVLLVDNAVAGLVMILRVKDSDCYFKINWLVVKKSEQHKGYGKKLLRYAFQEIKKLGGKYVYVETANERHNVDTKRFYLRMGFIKMGTLPSFFPPPVKKKQSLEEDYVLYYQKV